MYALEHQQESLLQAGFLTSMGLSIFIMIVGVVAFMPGQYFPEGTLFICAGIILLLVSFIIEIKHMDDVSFQAILGSMLLLHGVNSLLGLHVQIMAALIIVIGFAYFCSTCMEQFKNKKDRMRAYSNKAA